MLKNILVGQSGGPTAVINSSLYGVIEEGLRNREKIGTVYGMVHGIEGFLAGNFINLSEVADNEPIDRLKITPASFLGSAGICFQKIWGIRCMINCLMHLHR